jgi:hypothetical protein
MIVYWILIRYMIAIHSGQDIFLVVVRLIVDGRVSGGTLHGHNIFHKAFKMFQSILHARCRFPSSNRGGECAQGSFPFFHTLGAEWLLSIAFQLGMAAVGAAELCPIPP